jgi:hypothetical protein
VTSVQAINIFRTVLPATQHTLENSKQIIFSSSCWVCDFDNDPGEIRDRIKNKIIDK